MTGKTLELANILSPDLLATRLTERYIEWETLRQVKKNSWEEVRRYVFATDTSMTSNSKLPWKNRTTIPKLCQIRDNLLANYTATLFPKRKWLLWEANEEDDQSKTKRDAILNYISWCIRQPTFKTEMYKIIGDYIDFGNCFATVEWTDERVKRPDGSTEAGFVGPSIRRISPLDMVMNPTAENFPQSPKFIRSIISMGELKNLIDRMTNDENRDSMIALYDYLKEVRFHSRTFQGDWIQRDRLYDMDGFSSFRAYLLSDYVEVLTFYGDWYDYYTDTFEKNRVITVVDRHKLISNLPNPSFFGTPPIYHVPWRQKQDNLWGMGPLDNLIGMQYRLDHIENMKADILDFTGFPVQKVKGFVEDFVWQLGEKIFVSDEGDVEVVQAEANVLQFVQDIQMYMKLMEESAGAPQEAMGFRSPGEKTAYEVQRLENASSRIYQNKINQFEEQMVEPLLNAMLELAKRNMAGVLTISIFDDDFNFQTFQTLTVEDVTGVGRIKPVAARHFAEQAQLVQNLTSLTGSGLWPLIQPHFSGVKMSKAIENIFDLTDYGIISPFVSIYEQAEAQRQAQAVQEQVQMESQTATGMGSDFDAQGAHLNPGPDQGPRPGQMGLQRNPPANATPLGTLGTQ